MIYNKKVIVILLWLLLTTSACAVEIKYKNSTEEASFLLKEYVTSTDINTRETILNRLAYLYHSEPNNINLTRMYTGVLSSIGEYKKSILILESFNRKNNNTSLLLHECMLKDRVGDYDESCYKKVISSKLIDKNKDADYLMALFMTGDKRFNNEKRLYMKGRENDSDITIFENKKGEILKELYPN